MDYDIYAPLYDLLRQIPRGKVVTYGQAAEGVEGIRLTARMVGSAMRIAPDDVPWQRVVGAGGILSIGKRSPELLIIQRSLLENEGVQFLTIGGNRVDMSISQWLPDVEP